LTFIAQSKDSLWSLDLLRCESILLRTHWVMVVMDVFTRRIIGFGVELGSIDGVSVCRMFTTAIAGHPIPQHVSTDHDPLFRFHRWLANLRILEINEIKSIPYTPVSPPFVERLIGTIRREYLDQTLFWNSFDLARKLDEFKTTTTAAVFISRLTVSRRMNDLENLVARSQRSMPSVGKLTAADYLKRQWRSELPIRQGHAQQRLFLAKVLSNGQPEGWRPSECRTKFPARFGLSHSSLQGLASKPLAKMSSSTTCTILAALGIPLEKTVNA
jgi:hypothetical protein